MPAPAPNDALPNDSAPNDSGPTDSAANESAPMDDPTAGVNKNAEEEAAAKDADDARHEAATGDAALEEAAEAEPEADAEAEVEEVAAEEEPVEEEAAEAEAAVEVPLADGDREAPKFDWYILKVASNREESIKSALLRKARIAGLDYYFGEVIVPTETITEYKNNKRRTKKQKIWPGYLIVQMELNDDTWFLVRETPGIGDFTGSADRSAGARPSPMLSHEIEGILARCRPKKVGDAAAEEPRKPKIELNVGDHVKIIEGNLASFDGPIDKIDHSSGNVTVMITIFGRTTPVEVKAWQLEKA